MKNPFVKLSPRSLIFLFISLSSIWTQGLAASDGSVERIMCLPSEVRNTTIDTFRTDVQTRFIVPTIRLRGDEDKLDIFSDIAMAQPIYSDGLTATAWILAVKKQDSAPVLAYVQSDLPSRVANVIKEWPLISFNAWIEKGEVLFFNRKNELISLKLSQQPPLSLRSESVNFESQVLMTSNISDLRILSYAKESKTLLAQNNQSLYLVKIGERKVTTVPFPIPLGSQGNLIGQDGQNFHWLLWTRSASGYAWKLVKLDKNQFVTVLQQTTSHLPAFHFQNLNKSGSTLWMTLESVTGKEKSIVVKNMKTGIESQSFPKELFSQLESTVPFYKSLLQQPFSSEISPKIFYTLGHAGGIATWDPTTDQWSLHAQMGPGNFCLNPRITQELPWPE